MADRIDVKEAEDKRLALLEKLITPYVYLDVYYFSKESESDYIYPILRGDFHNFDGSYIVQEFQHKAFESYVKFFLSNYDEEDFERYFVQDKIIEEVKSLYRELWAKKPPGDQRPDGGLIQLFADEKIKLDEYTNLREVDIASIIEWQLNGHPDDLPPENFERNLVLDFNMHDKELEEKHWDFKYIFSKTASKAMDEYIPLKDEMRMHLTLEYVTGKCTCLADLLIAEALHRPGILAFTKRLPGFERQWEAAAANMLGQLSMQFKFRHITVKEYGALITYPLVYEHGPFGPFAEEVVELVKVAEARRRFENHRFISKYHILWAVITFSEIGNSVAVLARDSGLKDPSSPQEAATYPNYSIYKSARIVAATLGDEVVGVEHLAIASVCNTMLETVVRASSDAWTMVIKQDHVQTFLESVKHYKSDRGKIKLRKLNLEKMEPIELDTDYNEIFDILEKYALGLSCGKYNPGHL